MLATTTRRRSFGPATFARLAPAWAVLSCALVALPASAPAALVGYWTFDGDTAGTGNAVANLASGASAFNGTQVGAVGISSDVPTALSHLTGPRSLDLTSTATAGEPFVAINSSSVTQSTYGPASSHDGRYDTDMNTSFAISAWIKGLPDGSWEPFISKKGETAHGYQLRRHSSTSNLGTTIRGTSGPDDVDSGVAVSDGTWRHATLNWDGSRRKLYVDGALITDIADTGTMGAPTNEYLVFGARDNPAGTIGAESHIQLDDIAIYDAPLTEANILHLAAGGDPTNLAATIVAPAVDSFTVRDVKADGTTTLFNSTVVDSLDDADALLGGTGEASSTTVSADVINYLDSGADGNYGDNNPFPNGGGNDFAVQATANVRIYQDAWYTFGHNTDDGGRLRIDINNDDIFDDLDNVFENDVLSGAHDFFGSVYLTAGVYPLEYTYFERSGGAEAELFAAMGVHTSFDPDFFALLTVPEPTSGLLAGLGLAGLALRRRRRRRGGRSGSDVPGPSTR